jgi:hypothetical protein
MSFFSIEAVNLFNKFRSNQLPFLNNPLSLLWLKPNNLLSLRNPFNPLNPLNNHLSNPLLPLFHKLDLVKPPLHLLSKTTAVSPPSVLPLNS